MTTAREARVDADKRAWKAYTEEEKVACLLDAGGAFCLCVCASFAADLFEQRASSQSKLGRMRRMSCSCRHIRDEGRRCSDRIVADRRHTLGTCSFSSTLPLWRRRHLHIPWLLASNIDVRHVSCADGRRHDFECVHSIFLPL